MIFIIFLMIILASILILMYKEYISWSFNYYFVNVTWKVFLTIVLIYIMSTAMPVATRFFIFLVIMLGYMLSFHPADNDYISMHGFGEIPNTSDQKEAEA